MKFCTRVMLVLAGAALRAAATNFWLAEALTGDGCIGVGCMGSAEDLLFVTQNDQVPGCVQIEDARDAGAYPPGSSFQSVACGVTLNFYQGQDAGTYVYYENNGDGTQLGYCYSDNQANFFCLDELALGSTVVQGRYNCNNYSQQINGINPCVF